MHDVALAEGLAPALPDSANGTVAVEEPSPESVVDNEALVDGEASVSAEPEPLNTAGFLLDPPAVAAWPEEAPYSESWLELPAGPAMSEWPLQNRATFSL